MKASAKIADYAKTPALKRELARARDLGIEVAGYEVAPGGVIRVLDKAAFPATAPAAAEPVEDEIARWRERKRKA